MKDFRQFSKAHGGAFEALPRKFNTGSRQDMERMGVQFGKDVDDLLCLVELPAGWSKAPTENETKWRLVDEKGRKRASIFYDARYNDRDAFINVHRRFTISIYEPCDAAGKDAVGADATHLKTVVMDAEAAIHVVGVRSDASRDGDKHYEAAKKWLNEHYPDWESQAAYWD